MPVMYPTLSTMQLGLACVPQGCRVGFFTTLTPITPEQFKVVEALRDINDLSNFHENVSMALGTSLQQ